MSTQIIPYDIEAQKQAAAKLVESASIATLTLAAKSLESPISEELILSRTLTRPESQRVAASKSTG